jgi:serine/threonine-protein kinase
MASVWLSKDSRNEDLVALKMIRRRRAKDPEILKFFRREGNMLAALEHPGIVRLLDRGTLPGVGELEQGHSLQDQPWLPGSPYLVMEFINGEPLRSFVGDWDFGRVHRALLEVLAALSHAHGRGVLHRDVKPSNILVTDERVVLIDFGLAISGLPSFGGVQDENLILGSPSYMSPEQIRGNLAGVGPWSDLYGLGCTAWLLTAGQPVYRGTIPEVLARHLGGKLPEFEPRMRVPPNFAAWLRRMVAHAPEQRFESAAAAAKALRRCRVRKDIRGFLSIGSLQVKRRGGPLLLPWLKKTTPALGPVHGPDDSTLLGHDQDYGAKP